MIAESICYRASAPIVFTRNGREVKRMNLTWKGKAVSLGMSFLLAFTLMGGAAAPAFADEAQQSPLSPAEGLVYDSVYGVNGDYALMAKAVEGSDGAEMAQVDIVRSDGEVTMSSTLDANDLQYWIETASFSWTDHACVSVCDAETQLMGIVNPEGELQIPCKYDSIAPDGDKEYLIAYGRDESLGNVFADIYDRNVRLVFSVTIDNPNDYEEIQVTWQGNLYELRVFSSDSGPYSDNSESCYFEKGANGFQLISEGDGVYGSNGQIILQDNRVLWRNGADPSIVYEGSIVGIDANYQDILVIATDIEGEGYSAKGTFRVFDIAGDSAIDLGTYSASYPYTGSAAMSSLVERVSDSSYIFNLNETDMLISSDGTGLLEAPDLYAAGGYVISVDEEEGSTDVFNGLTGTLAKHFDESIYLHEFIPGRVYRAYVDGESRLYDSRLNEMTCDLEDPGYTYAFRQLPDGEMAYVVAEWLEGTGSTRYHVVDASLRHIQIGKYTLAMPTSVSEYAQWSSFQRGSSDVFYAVDDEGNYGAVDSSGGIVIPFEYEDYFDMGKDSTDLVLLKKDGKWFFYDTDASSEPGEPSEPSDPADPSDPSDPSDPDDPIDPDDPSDPADPVTFSDVDESTYHADDIAWLAQSGITTGFPDGTFRPMAEVARCDMAAFLYRLAGSPAYEVTEEDMAKFSDVDEGTPHLKEVCWLASEGISTGFPDGTFRPLASIARCDMAAFLERLGALMGAAEPGEGASFTDVDGSTPHAASIAWLSGTGITTGFPDGTFRPLDTIVRCDMAAFLHRLDGLIPA